MNRIDSRRIYAITIIVAAALTLGCLGAGMSAASSSKSVPDDRLIDPAAPAKGPDDAKVVVVEFSDFQCPYCSTMGDFLDELQSKHPDEIRVVWMDRPLMEEVEDGFGFHPYAIIAHEAGVEAQSQGKFWEFRAWLADNRKKVFQIGRPKDKEDLEKKNDQVRAKLVLAAEKLGMDKDAMKKALDDRTHQDTVIDRVEMARDLDIYGTPTVYVNGMMVGHDSESVEKAVNALLRKP